MKTTDLFPETPKRSMMGGKPVLTVPAKSIINFESGFSHKLLCDGPTFTTGSACLYRCSFCFVEDLMRKSSHVEVIPPGLGFQDVVIRRQGAIEAMRRQLEYANGAPKFLDPEDRRVIYASPLVDVAGNMELAMETVEACKLILTLTNWQIRLLSKSNLLPKIAQALDGTPGAKARVIYGCSTGTLDDRLAKAFEAGTPLVSKRLESLYWLQDNGYRTFGMVCPSLPQKDYDGFAQRMWDALRPWKMEHVWAEVINVRGESMTRTCKALADAGFTEEADMLEFVSTDKGAWELYARATFEAHASLYQPRQLRFLQYVGKDSREWWAARQSEGAILL